MNNTVTYRQAIDVLTSQGKFHINLGLERVQKALGLIGNPQYKIKCVHVAGTNGKGSVCTILSSILKEAGYKTGLFTSPHVFEYTERIKINDIEIPEEIFAQKVFEIITLADKNEIHLSEFEILTVLAFDYFARNNVDIVVLETGLGGRLDATNIIKENLCSVITQTGFDHTERLGDTIEKIAAEKAGIIKQSCPVVVSKDNKGFEVIREKAGQLNSTVFSVEELPNPYFERDLALKGTWQKKNLALVLKAVDVLKKKRLKISDKAIKEGLKKAKHPCRFEYFKDLNLIVDGAHNPDGASALRESLEEFFPNQKFRFVFGCLKNKNYPEMMKNLFKEDDEIYFCEFNSPNSCSFKLLQSACEFSAKPFKNFSFNKKLTVICGSLYMIKELLSKINTK